MVLLGEPRIHKFPRQQYGAYPFSNSLILVMKESVGMKLVAIYEHQPKIRSSGLLRRAKPDRFLSIEELRLKDWLCETLSSQPEGRAGP